MTGVAIVGTGRMAAAHARAWAGLAPRARVAAVVGAGVARPLADAPTARLTTDLDAVLSDPAIEAVSICTPTATHRDLALRALDAGKHVLLEKPIALTVEEGLALVRRAAPPVLLVAHVVRFFPGYVAVRDLAERGALGTLREVRAARLTSDADRPAWLDDEDRSGGVLVDLGVHDLDQLLLLLGPARTVRAARAPERSVEVVVQHTGGGIGRIRVGWDLPRDRPFETDLEAVGELGSAGYSFREAAPGRSELRVASADGSSARHVDPGDPYGAQAAAFLEAVVTGVPPVHGSPADALAALRLALAARESLRTGRPVTMSG